MRNAKSWAELDSFTALFEEVTLGLDYMFTWQLDENWWKTNFGIQFHAFDSYFFSHFYLNYATNLLNKSLFSCHLNHWDNLLSHLSFLFRNLGPDSWNLRSTVSARCHYSVQKKNCNCAREKIKRCNKILKWYAQKTGKPNYETFWNGVHKVRFI